MNQWLDKKQSTPLALPWTTSGKQQLAKQREAQQSVEKTKLHMLQAELRKREIGQLLANADELMDVAVNLAGGDEGRFEVFADIVRQAIRTEQLIHARQHDAMAKWLFQ